MNIKELKSIIADLPDDLPVLEGPHDDRIISGNCWAEIVTDTDPHQTPVFLWIAY